MLAKDKAENLVLSFFRIQDGQHETTWEQAKQCALIHINELLFILQNLYFTGHVDYWQEVKTEIQKL